MIEKGRGCGHRKIGGIYIEADGIDVPCDRLNYNIEPCKVCGQGIHFSRGFTWIHWFHYAGTHKKCHCFKGCPICQPKDTKEITVTINGKDEKQIVPVKHGLMFVGKKYYTPEKFIKEAKKMGISKRISTIPKELELGKTWVLLAHMEAGERLVDATEELTNGNKTIDGKCQIKVPAILYAFVPKRIVQLITPIEATDKDFVDNLKKRGITPLVGITDGKGNVSESFELEEWTKKQSKTKKAKKKGVKLVKPRLKKKIKRKVKR